MKLLVTNDDGVASPGLWTLAESFRDAGVAHRRGRRSAHDTSLSLPQDPWRS